MQYDGKAQFALLSVHTKDKSYTGWHYWGQHMQCVILISLSDPCLCEKINDMNSKFFNTEFTYTWNVSCKQCWKIPHLINFLYVTLRIWQCHLFFLAVMLYLMLSIIGCIRLWLHCTLMLYISRFYFCFNTFITVNFNYYTSCKIIYFCYWLLTLLLSIVNCVFLQCMQTAASESGTHTAAWTSTAFFPP